MFIAAPHIRKADYSEVRAARAFALVAMAVHDAAVGCWETKYFYYNPRPSHLDPELKSVIGLPNFPSYTSGHSTFSGSAAEVLSYLFPNSRAEFERLRDEASISRLYGGIHYRSDIDVGKEHGKRLAGYVVRFALTDGADLRSRPRRPQRRRNRPCRRLSFERDHSTSSPDAGRNSPLRLTSAARSQDSSGACRVDDDEALEHVHAAYERDLARFVGCELDRDGHVERQVPPDIQ